MFTIPYVFPGSGSPLLAATDNVYLFGGIVAGSPVNTIRRFNGKYVTSQSATLGSTSSSAGTSQTLGSYAYVFGGGNAVNNKIQSFDKTTVALVTTMGYGSYDISSAKVSSNIYIFGGYRPSTFDTTNEIRKFDGSNYSTESATLEAAIQSTAASNISTTAYIIGGNAGGAAVTKVQSYDGTTRTTVLTQSPVTQGDQKRNACTLGSTMYLFGGQNIQYSGYLNSIWSWDGTTYAYTTKTMDTHMCAGVACATYGSKINMFGGTDGTVSSYAQSFDGTTVTTVNTSITQIYNSTASTL